MSGPGSWRVRAVVCSWVMLACQAGRENASSERDGTRTAAADALQAQVDWLLEETGLPGISVAVAERGGEGIVAAAGFANREGRTPVRPESRFFIGSISKNVFGVIALMLVEEGRLNLDDPLSAYVEWPRGSEITIRMLLNHSSGIPDYMTNEIFASRDGAVPEFFTAPRSPADIFQIMPSRLPTFDPGSQQSYSNTNGVLVGEVIKAITGSTLGQVLQERIAEPLGLRTMYLYEEPGEDEARARGYCDGANWGGGSGTLLDCSFADEALPASADGSIVTSAADLLSYHRALRNGGLLGDAQWHAMRTVEPGLDNGLAYLIGDGPFGRYEGSAGRSMGHVSANIYYVDRDIFLVMMMNRGDGSLPLRQFMERRYGTN